MQMQNPITVGTVIEVCKAAVKIVIGLAAFGAGWVALSLPIPASQRGVERSLDVLKLSIHATVDDICRAPADRKSTRLNSSH